MIGNDLIVPDFEHLVDLHDDIGRGSLAWSDRGACQGEAAAGAATQPNMGRDLNMLAYNRHVFDEKCEYLSCARGR